MTLRHGNRIRQTGGEQVVRDVQAADAGEVTDGGPTRDEVRQRGYNRPGPQGRAGNECRIGYGPKPNYEARRAPTEPSISSAQQFSLSAR
jgi:hypothetical protein